MDAVFCAYGGGGCSAGVGSALKNYSEDFNVFPSVAVIQPPIANGRPRIDMVSVEPATAAPLCFSFNAPDRARTGELTPLPAPDSGDPNRWQPSWVDGCGGKSVLKPMWGVAQDVLTGAYKVECH